MQLPMKFHFSLPLLFAVCASASVEISVQPFAQRGVPVVLSVNLVDPVAPLPTDCHVKWSLYGSLSESVIEYVFHEVGEEEVQVLVICGEGGEIFRDSINLHVVDPPLIAALANLVTNSEYEGIRWPGRTSVLTPPEEKDERVEVSESEIGIVTYRNIQAVSMTQGASHGGRVFVSTHRSVGQVNLLDRQGGILVWPDRLDDPSLVEVMSLNESVVTSEIGSNGDVVVTGIDFGCTAVVCRSHKRVVGRINVCVEFPLLFSPVSALVLSGSTGSSATLFLRSDGKEDVVRVDSEKGSELVGLLGGKDLRMIEFRSKFLTFFHLHQSQPNDLSVAASLLIQHGGVVKDALRVYGLKSSLSREDVLVKERDGKISVVVQKNCQKSILNGTISLSLDDSSSQLQFPLIVTPIDHLRLDPPNTLPIGLKLGQSHTILFRPIGMGGFEFSSSPFVNQAWNHSCELVSGTGVTIHAVTGPGKAGVLGCELERTGEIGDEIVLKVKVGTEFSQTVRVPIRPQFSLVTRVDNREYSLPPSIDVFSEQVEFRIDTVDVSKTCQVVHDSGNVHVASDGSFTVTQAVGEVVNVTARCGVDEERIRVHFQRPIGGYSVEQGFGWKVMLSLVIGLLAIGWVFAQRKRSKTDAPSKDVRTVATPTIAFRSLIDPEIDTFLVNSRKNI